MGILVSWGMLFYRTNQVEENKVAVKRGLSQKRLLDVYNKIVDLPGDRGLESETARKNSRRTIALIRGTLGPQNVGYTIREDGVLNKKGELWRSYWVEKEGGDDSLKPLVLLTSYLPDPGHELSNAADLAVSVEVAGVIAGQSPQQTIRFVFLPDLEMQGSFLDDATEVLKINSAVVGRPKENETSLSRTDMNDSSSFMRLPNYAQDLLSILQDSH